MQALRWPRLTAPARLLLLGLWMGLGLPAAAADPAGERERIARERAALDARYAEASAACSQRFLVTDCLEQARAERRQGLDLLQRQQLLLDDARRRERAALRLQAIENRLAEQDRADSPRPPRAPRQSLQRAPTGASRPARPDAASAAASSSASATAATATAAAAQAAARLPARQPPAQGTPATPQNATPAAGRAQRQQAFEQRQREAEAHRQAVQRRNAQQDAQHPPAASLPLPTPAVAPAAPVAASAARGQR